MVRRLPPLNALRAFEAAARHLSFTRAADELNVTQAAVSHQVKALEEWLGMPLFRRLNRSLLLTDAGQSYMPRLRDAFDTIDQATRGVNAHESGRTLTISTIDSFAAKWLVPRLGRFRAGHPENGKELRCDRHFVVLPAAGSRSKNQSPRRLGGIFGDP